MAWTLGFVGAGVMAEVMITGLLEEGVLPPAQIFASDRRQARLDELATGHGVRVTTDNREVAEAADVLVLAVKPQNLPDVLPELRGLLRPEAAALSIIAGARLSTLTDALGHRAVARCMPNLPCRIRRGMTVWTAAPGFPELDRVRQILRVMGEEVFVEEEQHVDRATAVSGTGPAVVAEFVKALFEAAVYVGQPRDVAHDTVLATVIGTAEMIRRGGADGVHVAQLIDEVTSPGGTTSRALHALKKGHFQATVTDAVDAAYQRTVELGRPARG
jgi:pyrroline-5-carboxylate reductase